MYLVPGEFADIHFGSLLSTSTPNKPIIFYSSGLVINHPCCYFISQTPGEHRIDYGANARGREVKSMPIWMSRCTRRPPPEVSLVDSFASRHSHCNSGLPRLRQQCLQHDAPLHSIHLLPEIRKPSSTHLPPAGADRERNVLLSRGSGGGQRTTLTLVHTVTGTIGKLCVPTVYASGLARQIGVDSGHCRPCSSAVQHRSRLLSA